MDRSFPLACNPMPGTTQVSFHVPVSSPEVSGMLSTAQVPSSIHSLIDERFDHDFCGVGFVAAVDAVPSHKILKQALTALARLAHRGATAADGKSSDGVGIMAAIPRELLLREAGLSIEPEQLLGVGMV